METYWICDYRPMPAEFNAMLKKFRTCCIMYILPQYTMPWQMSFNLADTIFGQSVIV